MNNFIYEANTKIIFGRGCVKEFLACLVSGSDNIMLAYGQDSAKRNGIYDEVLNILMKEGKHVTEYPGIMPNPTYRKVLEGVKAVRENQVEMILGVGGGSVMDCCKAVSLAAGCEGDAWENFWERRGIIDFQPIPVGVIATTSGTGSACSGAAVITNEEQRVKTGHDYPKCNPVFALLDPAYTLSVPVGQMISGAAASLSYIMESYLSEPDEQSVSDEMAEALMRSVINNLRQAVREPHDHTARSNLMWTSVLAQSRLIKLGKKCDFTCRLMEHQLSAYTGCGHSQGMAVLHPAYCRHIYRGRLARFARFAGNVWMIPGEGRSEEELAAAGIDALEDFIREAGLPSKLRELGIKDQRLFKKIADSCYDCPGTEQKIGTEEILEIFRECY